MTIQRYKLALNNARFPLVSTWGSRAVLVPSVDGAARTSRGFQGGEDNIDYDIPQILYGENFVPVVDGVKSVSYTRFIAPTVATDFDQIFPIRDADENTILFSPAKGKNYIYDEVAAAWTADWSIINVLLALTAPSAVSNTSPNTTATAKVTRAYVEGHTFICYSRLLATHIPQPPIANFEASLYTWDPDTLALYLVHPTELGAIPLVLNLGIPLGEIDGVSSSNGYLIVWSGLTVYWAPFNGTAFDFELYANGEVTGAGNQIPEDLLGPITACVPVSGGFIIFTTKNAVAAFYNANNFASPWIFKAVANAGGLESFEQASVEGAVGLLYAYTTGGLQKITLNSAESDFPDVTDFLGGHFLESFNTGDLTLSEGSFTTEYFVKVTFCGQRFLAVSYGTYPGVYSYCLIYDSSLKRWGKLRIVHRDCFSYSYGVRDAEVTYNMLQDIPYESLDIPYEDMIIEGGALTYPRQAVAFLKETGEVVVAVMDYRDPDDISEAFVVVGKNQFSRSRLSTLHELEVEGLKTGGQVACWRSVNGATFETADVGVLREQTQQYSEWGFDNITGKNITFYIKGDFTLTTLIAHISNDASF